MGATGAAERVNAMTNIPREHIPLFIDRIRMLGEIRLASDVIYEIFRGYAQYQTMQFTLDQIAQGGKSNVDLAAWAKRTIEADEKSRKAMKLRYPRRLNTLEGI